MYEFPYGACQQLNLNWIINEIITLHKQLDPDWEMPQFDTAFPYTNLNQLNLDWILRELKAIQELAPPAPNISSDNVDNESNVIGDTVTDALNTLNNKKTIYLDLGNIPPAEYPTRAEQIEQALNLIDVYDKPVIFKYTSSGRWSGIALKYTDGHYGYIIASYPNDKSTYLGYLVNDVFTLHKYDGSSNSVSNDSNVTGATVTDALNNLNGAITHEYVVDINGGGDYTSLTACFLALKNDKEKKIIRVKCGDYNIYNEYVSASVPVYTGSSPSTEYYDYNVWIPDNTHLIGEGVVRLLWQPTSSQVTQKQSATVSPLNIGNNCCIENVEIYCKNGRYCIHDDPYKPSDTSIASAAKGSIHKLINVRCYKQANDSSLGYSNIVGIGIHNSIQYLYENCLFNSEINDSAFYAHTNFNDAGTSLEAENSNIFVFNNCRFENNGGACVSLRNTPTYIRVKELAVFNNCWFKNQIDLIDNAPATPHNANAWQLVLNGCNETTINIDDANNTYAPIIVNETPVKSDFEWGTLSSNTSGGSVYAQKYGDIILLNGVVTLNGSVAGASALIATFSDIKPLSTTKIYAYGKYNNDWTLVSMQFKSTGEIVTYTGGGTFTDTITFFNSVLFL